MIFWELNLYLMLVATVNLLKLYPILQSSNLSNLHFHSCPRQKVLGKLQASPNT